jgi:hypothetical protein
MKGLIELGICNEPFSLTEENKINIETLLKIWKKNFYINCNFITNQEPYRLGISYYKGKKISKTKISLKDYCLIIKSLGVRHGWHFEGEIDNKLALKNYDKLINPVMSEKEMFLEDIEYYKKNNIPYKISEELMQKFSIKT